MPHDAFKTLGNRSGRRYGLKALLLILGVVLAIQYGNIMTLIMRNLLLPPKDNAIFVFTLIHLTVLLVGIVYLVRYALKSRKSGPGLHFDQHA